MGIQLTLEDHCFKVLLIGEFLFVTNSIVLNDLGLAEPQDAKMRLWRNHIYGGQALSYTQIFYFIKGQRPEHTHTALLKGQLYFKYPLNLCYCVSIVNLVFWEEHIFLDTVLVCEVGNGKERHYGLLLCSTVPDCTDVESPVLISTKRNIFQLSHYFCFCRYFIFLKNLFFCIMY